MALRVWLPLTGTLENKGISNVNITGSNVTANASGKIGSCYSFNGSSSYIKLDQSFVTNSTTEFSYTCWAKFNSTASGCLFSARTAVNSNGISLFVNNSGNILYDIGNERRTKTYSFSTGVWYHIAFTYKKGNYKKIYINGVEIDSVTSTGTMTTAGSIAFIGASQNTNTTVNGNYLNSYLNDVRIYDHCLSAAEVKEISQGLVLHYKLDSFQGGYGNSNLYTGSKDFSGTWVNGNNWTTATETYQGFTVKQRSATWGGLCQNVTCTQNDIFTVSFYAKVDSGGQIMSIHRSSLGNVTTGLNILGGNFSSGTNWITTNQDGTQWKRYWATVQITSADITYLQWRIENNQSGKNLYVCGMKLEKGSSHTDWSPAANEGSFNIIPDSSGYGHNGSITGNISITSNSNRYSNCIYIPSGNTDYITTNDEIGNFSSGITMNIWFKSSCTTPGSNYHEIFNIATATQNFEMAIYKTGYFRGGMIINGTRYVDNTNNTNIVDGNWHMITMTYDGTTLRRYVDAIDKKDTTISGTLTSTFCKFLLGHYGTNTSYYAKEAYLSDARIYCTALSTDDIKQLYQVGAKVDNLHNIHTFEYSENSTTIKLTKQGQLKEGEIQEDITTKFYKIDKIIKSKQFIER